MSEPCRSFDVHIRGDVDITHVLHLIEHHYPDALMRIAPCDATYPACPVEPMPYPHDVETTDEETP